MKLIKTDNFDTETVSDVLIAQNVDEYWGKRIVELLNKSEGEDSHHFFKLVSDDHKLYEFNP